MTQVEGDDVGGTCDGGEGLRNPAVLPSIGIAGQVEKEAPVGGRDGVWAAVLDSGCLCAIECGPTGDRSRTGAQFIDMVEAPTKVPMVFSKVPLVIRSAWARPTPRAKMVANNTTGLCMVVPRFAVHGWSYAFGAAGNGYRERGMEPLSPPAVNRLGNCN
jgi:hypothetical protein